jgi:hypothetical protein
MAADWTARHSADAAQNSVNRAENQPLRLEAAGRTPTDNPAAMGARPRRSECSLQGDGQAWHLHSPSPPARSGQTQSVWHDLLGGNERGTL